MAEEYLFDQWEAASLRVSLFPPASPTELWEDTGGLARLWEGVTDTKPDAINSQPKMRATRIEGETAEGRLRLVAQSNQRVEWLAIGEPTDMSPTLRDVHGALRLLRRATDLSLGWFPQVQRLALGAALAVSVRDPAEGLMQLSKFLPKLELDSMDSSDFVYAVNRRRRSTAVTHVRINRLAKWSIVQVGTLEFALAAQPVPVLNTSKIGFIRRLDLDINNDPQAGMMAKAKIPGLLDELVSLASEIAQKGDIP